MPFNYRKWNILAFRGRLMSLLVLTHSGVSPRPHLPQDKEGFGSDTSHAEKAVFFFKESRIFHLLGQIIVYSAFLYSSQFHKRFNLFIIRSIASLIGTEGGDSCGNSMSLETPECEAHGGSSHARGKRPPAVEINSFSSYPKNTD